MGPRNSPKDTHVIFQPTLLHSSMCMYFKFELCTLNAQKPNLCIKKAKRTPKKSKIKHNTPVLLCWHYNFFESNKRQRISFRPQRWHVPYRNHHACCDELWFARSLYPNLPQMGQIFYHGMLMPLHHSMPSFMNFRRVLHLQELKNQVSQNFADNQQCPGVWI